MPFFLSPAYLSAIAAAILIPLILHLSRQRKPVVAPFSTLKFLEQALAQTRRYRKVSNLLLLLLRILILSLLVLSFSQPIYHISDSWQNERRTLIMVIDSSAGMRLENDKSLFEQARQWALSLVDSLEPGDRAAVVAAGSETTFLLFPPISDLDRVRETIQELEPGFASAIPAETVYQSMRRLDFGRETPGLEVHVFSDFRTHSWPKEEITAWKDQLPSEIFFFLNRVQSPRIVNAGITGVDFTPTAILNRDDAVLQTRSSVKTGSDFAGPLPLRLFLLSRKHHQVNLTMEPDSEEKVELTAPVGNRDSPHLTGKVETGKDMFEADNRFYFSLPKIEESSLLIVSSREDVKNLNGASYILQAVNAASKTDIPFLSKTVNHVEFSAEKPGEEVDIIIVNGYEALPESGIEHLRELVRAGTAVMIIPAQKDRRENFFTLFLQNFGNIQTQLIDYPDTKAETLITGKEQVHPAENIIQRILPFPARIPLKKRLRFSELPPKAERIMSYADGSPFLWTVPAGAGRLWVSSTGVERQWSEWALSPFFVVTMREIIRTSISERLLPLTVKVGDTLPLFIPGRKTKLELQIKNPAGKKSRTTLLRQRPEQPFPANGFSQPGIYHLLSDKKEWKVAVNLPETELDFNYLSPSELAAALPETKIYQAADWEEHRDQIAKLKKGRPLWPGLLLTAFLTTMIELLLISRMNRD